MPFGKKPGAGGAVVDFDAVYAGLIRPAIEAAGLEPLRADEEAGGGIIHKPMFERLILCEYAVADLTTANANVFYELGLRHAVRPSTTALVFARGGERLPFDVAPLRALPYDLGPDGRPAAAGADREALAARLREARSGAADSPVYQLVDGFPDVQRLKTDVFRERVASAESLKARLAAARAEGVAALRALQAELEPLADADAAVAVDLLLSYRAVKAWGEMAALVPRLSPPLAATPLVQEQLAFGLNRAGRGDEAERVLLDLLQRRGPSSETCGLLGRVHKDRWEAARRAGDALRARGLLRQAIDAYRKGFEADWRDAYPGINAVTLMEIAEPPDPARERLLPVVRYAVERRLAGARPDYWDHATLVELAVLAKDEGAAASAVADALAAVRERWEPESTARNLQLIREARERRGEPVAWALEVEQALARAALPPGGDGGGAARPGGSSARS
jgi:tetratricopeptide (TPR) repeat protein